MDTPVRILLQNRDPRTHFGGDMVQLWETQRALERLGVIADFSFHPAPDLRAYDLVHLFHTNFRFAVRMAGNAVRQGKPLVLSAIYYDTDRFGVRYAEQRTIVEAASRVLMFSQAEQMDLERCLSLSLGNKAVLIPNGVSRVFRPEGVTFSLGRPYVLSAGRLEAHKGHHRVLQAALRLGVPLIVAGGPLDSDYARQLKQIGGEQVILTGQVRPEPLAALYRGAQVFALASASERANLCLLEAAACGCNLVAPTTNRGNVWLPGVCQVDPFDIEALTDAMAAELAAPRGHLRLEVPSWDDVAQQVLAVYREVVSPCAPFVSEARPPEGSPSADQYL